MIDLFELAGRNAVVIGGGYGMGRRTALLLAEVGASVAVVDIDQNRAHDVSKEVQAKGVRSLAIVADVADANQCDSVIESAAALGELHVLVNIVGRGVFCHLMEMERGVFESQLPWNATYVLYIGAAFARRARDRGHGGSIVNIGSINGLRGAPGRGAYSASKAIITALTQTMAAEWGRYGIRANVVVPGATRTDRTQFTPEWEDGLESLIPMGRVGTQDEIAKVILFLASNMSSFITGQLLVHDGGHLMALPGRDADGEATKFVRV